MFSPWALSALVSSTALSVACVERSVMDILPLPSGQTQSEFEVDLNRNLDLLFVIDDSDSMRREQEQLAIHARRMIEVLEGLPGGRPNLHIGVVSTDVGTGCAAPEVPAGVLRSEPNPSGDPRLDGCTGPRDRYLSDVVDDSGERARNYDGELADAFACIATLGTGGCGFEAPLEAMRLALSPDTEANRGFRRDDAWLAVVFLTDEDDCSAFDPRLFGIAETVDGHTLGPRTSFRCFAAGVTCEDGSPWRPGPRVGCTANDSSPFLVPIDEYVAALRRAQPDPDRLIVAGIMGAPEVVVGVSPEGQTRLEPSCVLGGGGTDTTETAFPPVRTDGFLARFEAAVRTSICAEDLAPAVETIGRAITSRLYGRCIPGVVVDVRTDQPGLQPDCVVTETQAPSSPAPQRTALPACPVGPSAVAEPCWQAVPEPLLCAGMPSELEIEVRYPDGATRAPDTSIEFWCWSR